jgi:hypothetical protein
MALDLALARVLEFSLVSPDGVGGLSMHALVGLAMAKGGQALDPRWVMVPVGGADKLSTFVSLIGANQLNVAVLMDVSTKDQQLIRELQKNGHLGAKSLVQVGQFVGRDDADIEDLFSPAFYLKLVNGAYPTELSKKLVLKGHHRQEPPHRPAHRLALQEQRQRNGAV